MKETTFLFVWAIVLLFVRTTGAITTCTPSDTPNDGLQLLLDFEDGFNVYEDTSGAIGAAAVSVSLLSDGMTFSTGSAPSGSNVAMLYGAGAGDNVELDFNCLGADFTISAWIKPSWPTTVTRGVLALGSGAKSLSVQLSDEGTIEIFDPTTNATADGVVLDAPLVTDYWTLLTLVYNAGASTLHVFYDGVPLQSVSLDLEFAAAPVTLFLATLDGISDAFDGYFDYVTLWTRALTPAETDTLYALAPVEFRTFNAGLVLWWKYELAEEDATGHGRAPILENGTFAYISTTPASSHALSITDRHLWISGDYDNLFLLGNPAFSVSLWVFIGNLWVDRNFVWEHGCHCPGAFLIYFTAIGDLRVGLWGSTWGSSSNEISVPAAVFTGPNRWAHVVVTHDRQTTRVFIDGDLRGELDLTYDFVAQSTSIGVPMNYTNDDTVETFIGDVDEIMFYNRALRSDEILKTFMQADLPERLKIGLVLQWHFEGTLTDSSGASNDATGSPAFVPGAINQAASVGNSNVIISNSGIRLSSGSKASFTLAMWIKMVASIAAAEPLIAVTSIQQDGSLYWKFIRDLGVLRVGAINGGYVEHSIPQGKWAHVAVTYAQHASLLELWINGYRVKQSTLDLIINSGTLQVGSEGFVALVDEVQLWDRPLFADELEQVACPQGVCPPTGCPAGWTDDAGSCVACAVSGSFIPSNQTIACDSPVFFCSAGTADFDNDPGTPCLPCPSGSISSQSSTSCSECQPGEFAFNASYCSLCPSGSVSDASSTSCSECQPGEFALNASYCSPCPSGSVSDASSTSCSECQPGEFAFNASYCSPCPSGTISSQSSTSCSECQPGEFAFNASYCSPCQEGFFSNKSSAVSCDPCEGCAVCDPETGVCPPVSSSSAALSSSSSFSFDFNSPSSSIPSPSFSSLGVGQSSLTTMDPSSAEALSSDPKSGANVGLIVGLTILGVFVVGAAIIAAVFFARHGLHSKKGKSVSAAKPADEVEMHSQSTSASGPTFSPTSSATPLEQRSAADISSAATAATAAIAIGALATSKDAWDVAPGALEFGLRDQADVGETYEQSVTVTNKTISRLVVSVVSPESNKYSVEITPPKARLRAGTSKSFTVSVTLHCTTTPNPIFVVGSYTQNGAETVEHFEVRLAISGKLSSRLDFDELVFKQTIGEGSFGTVARGTWRNIDVAIKTLKETMVELSPEARADFLREVDLLERLRSPNIVAFMGAVITKKKMILVTEFSPLGSLDAVIRKYNLGEKLRLLFALDIAKGVSFLHTSGIIHRDLKPGNVLVFDLSPTAPTRCKLTDFGTSRAVAARTEIAMTKGLGTPLYMAPEILKGSSSYTKAADVFSFAIMLVEIFSGKVPYSDVEFSSSFALTEHVLSGKRPEIPEGCPEAVANIIRTNWDADPSKRQGFGDIISALDKTLQAFIEEEEFNVQDGVAAPAPFTEKQPMARTVVAVPSEAATTKAPTAAALRGTH